MLHWNHPIYRMERETDRTGTWLTVIDALAREARSGRAPTVADALRLLGNVQGALKRWRWEGKSRRGAAPSRWLIDDEADVQALLWAVLYPVYGDALVDEAYLPHTGQTQPRCDLGITSLGMIVEVKVLRAPADFKAIEAQVAADAGLYFREPNHYGQLAVFVYDDSDRARPERYAALTQALTRQERVCGVVIARRPGMLPERGAR